MNSALQTIGSFKGKYCSQNNTPSLQLVKIIVQCLNSQAQFRSSHSFGTNGRGGHSLIMIK